MDEPQRTIDEAFRCFDRWRSEHDPDERLEFLDAAAAYSVWADANSIVKYLDANWTDPTQTNRVES